jgi:hypothetical protein
VDVCGERGNKPRVNKRMFPAMIFVRSFSSKSGLISLRGLPLAAAPAKLTQARSRCQKPKFALSPPSGPVLILAGFCKVELTLLTDPMVGGRNNLSIASPRIES